MGVRRLNYVSLALYLLTSPDFVPAGNCPFAASATPRRALVKLVRDSYFDTVQNIAELSHDFAHIIA